MNVFHAGKLAQAFDIPYPTAERIIREARAKHQRRWLPLTVMGIACALAGLALALFDAPVHKLARHLCFTTTLVLILLEHSLTRRAARQPILDAARLASPRKG